MVRIQLHIELNYMIDADSADFVFNIHAAHTPSQTVSAERLNISQPVDTYVHTDPATGNRYLRLRAFGGPLQVTYSATADISHHLADTDCIPEVPVHQLPPETMGYVYPSRYCESDRLLRMAASQFGHLPQGYARVQAIRDWVHRHVAYAANTTNANTSALDTLVEQVGVCRDYAHLMIAICRACNIPARFTTGTDFGSDPYRAPPDFHAYVEAYLGDRWYIFDPAGTAIPMGFLRFGTGRDAADVAFATIFGQVQTQAPLIRTTAIDNPTLGIVLPHLCQQALSTDSGAPPLRRTPPLADTPKTRLALRRSRV